MRPTTWRVLFGSVAALVGLASLPVAGQQSPPAPTGSIALVVTFANGRRSPITVGPSIGGAWMSTFTRLAAWTPPPDELPVSAINFICHRKPDGVDVTVSIFRGSPRQREDPVTTVLVTPATPVVVDELRNVGLEPVTLSIAPLATPHLTAPAVAIPSPLLTVVEAVALESPVPKYVVTVRNAATKSVRGLDMAATRGGQMGVTTRRRGREGAALIEPNGTYTFDIPESAGAPGSRASQPIDRVAFPTVIWTDGSYDGNATTAGLMFLLDQAEVAQLGHVRTELERARIGGGATPETLHAALDWLSIDATPALVEELLGLVPNGPSLPAAGVTSSVRLSLESVKKTFLDDLSAFEDGPRPPGAFEGWLNSALARAQRWSGLLAR